MSRRLAASPHSVDERDAILREEVHPACLSNLFQVAGEWAGFDAAWLERHLRFGGPPPRTWWCRLGRYLLLGWSVPEERASWRQDIIQHRTGPTRNTPT